ncbi:hypothetical protein [Treponema pectinovorum]|uniref:hypothetical protein n=1 Tax=Treponema pectinovorum TaxID=164 RepID=UPI0011C9D3A8|nr:hypothetical protein [Treponema pectinovorum]
MKSTLFALRRAALLLVALTSISLTMVSCNHEEDDTPYSDSKPLTAESQLVGSWKSSYGEVYTITPTTFASQGSYEGNELKVIFTNKANTQGYIYIKYTKAYESTTTNPNDASWTYSSWSNSWYRYSTTAPDVGKWYAISFKGLTSSSVQLSGAYGAKSSTATLEQAIDTFTVENGYFATYSSCSRK